MGGVEEGIKGPPLRRMVWGLYSLVRHQQLLQMRWESPWGFAQRSAHTHTHTGSTGVLTQGSMLGKQALLSLFTLNSFDLVILELGSHVFIQACQDFSPPILGYPCRWDDRLVLQHLATG
jgi:hypothetical protein